MEKLIYHLRFSFRVFLKDKFFSALNVTGLAMGIAVGIIMVLILKNDLTYDKHYANHKNIYRLGAHYAITGVDMMTGFTARELTPILKDHYPEIEKIVRVSFRDLEHMHVKAGTKSFFEERVAETDSTYFQVFNHQFVEGDVNTCLDDPNSVVLTQSVARKYFGDESALGKLVTMGKKVKTVSAVIADHPENTDLKFDFLVAGLPEIRPTWQQTYENGKPIALVFWNPDSYTYMVLPENYDVNNFYNRFQPIFDEYFTGLGDDFINTPVLQPLAEIHFSGFEGETPGSMTYLLALSGIGLLIVILACINYMNLSTAKAIKRSTEITMKRISGSARGSLVVSLIGESVLMSLISLLVAIGIVYVVLDLTSFNVLIGKHITFDLFNEPMLLLASFGVAVMIGVASGVYPAFYLTNVPIISSLKGTFKTGKAGLLMRKSLITVQFCVSMFVVLITLFMSEQVEFARTKDLGFDKNNLLVIPLQDTATEYTANTIINELATDSRIASATASGQIVGTGTGGEQMWIEGEKGMEQKGGVQCIYTANNYIETIGLELVAGRDFRSESKEEDAFIVNEAMVKMMGWGDNAIGKKMEYFMHHHPGTVVGVVKDFNMGSLHEAIEPLFMIKGHWRPGYLHLRLTGNDVHGVVEQIKQKWSVLEPGQPFEYFFIDQKYDDQYKADVIQKRLLEVLSYVCIAISLLGLLGLSAFTAVQRTKEIGVRKVLGASVPGILILLSKDILVLVIFASVIAIPASWLVIDAWMQGFAYRTPVNYILYAITIASALMFVLFVTAFQSLKTATANPVKSLKYE